MLEGTPLNYNEFITEYDTYCIGLSTGTLETDRYKNMTIAELKAYVAACVMTIFAQDRPISFIDDGGRDG